MKATQLIIYTLRIISIYMMVTCLSYVFYIFATIFSTNFTFLQISGILPACISAAILWFSAPPIAKLIGKNDELQIQISEVSLLTLTRVMIIGVGLFYAISSLSPIFTQFITMLLNGVPNLPKFKNTTILVSLFGSFIELAVGLLIVAKSEWLSYLILKQSTIRTEQGAAANP